MPKKVEKYGSKRNRLTQEVILRLFDRGLVKIPFRPEDKDFLVKLEEVLKDRFILRRVLRFWPMRERQTLIATADMSRAEGYIFSRYRNKIGKTIDTRLLVSELAQYYHVTDPIKARQLVYKVRGRFYNWQHRQKKPENQAT